MRPAGCRFEPSSFHESGASFVPDAGIFSLLDDAAFDSARRSDRKLDINDRRQILNFRPHKVPKPRCGINWRRTAEVALFARLALGNGVRRHILRRHIARRTSRNESNCKKPSSDHLEQVAQKPTDGNWGGSRQTGFRTAVWQLSAAHAPKADRQQSPTDGRSDARQGREVRHESYANSASGRLSAAAAIRKWRPLA